MGLRDGPEERAAGLSRDEFGRNKVHQSFLMTGESMQPYAQRICERALFAVNCQLPPGYWRSLTVFPLPRSSYHQQPPKPSPHSHVLPTRLDSPRREIGWCVVFPLVCRSHSAPEPCSQPARRRSGTQVRVGINSIEVDEYTSCARAVHGRASFNLPVLSAAETSLVTISTSSSALSVGTVTRFFFDLP